VRIASLGTDDGDGLAVGDVKVHQGARPARDSRRGQEGRRDLDARRRIPERHARGRGNLLEHLKSPGQLGPVCLRLGDRVLESLQAVPSLPHGLR
jgi:hypothetical protein